MLLLRRVAFFQDGDGVSEGEFLDAHEDHQVEDQVGSFAGEFGVLGGECGERSFNTFLADFLGAAANAFLREADGVAGLVAALDPGGDDLVEVREETHAGGAFIAKATGRAAVTGWARRIHFDEQGIVVAVHPDADDVEEVAGALTLGPETLFGAAEVGHAFGAQRFLQRLGVHVAEHEHLQRGGVLHDGRHKTVGFLPVDFGSLHESNLTTDGHRFTRMKNAGAGSQ